MKSFLEKWKELIRNGKGGNVEFTKQYTTILKFSKEDLRKYEDERIKEVSSIR